MPRKHLVAQNTNKKQQQQAKIWQKLSREIKAAVKVGGPNQEANPRLRAAVVKALDNNLSKESIEKNINGNNKDEKDLNQVEFECYGENGLQIIIGALTDNTNRTIANINGYLAKLHGTIAKQNSVKVFFTKLGYIIVEKSSEITYDKLLENLMDLQIIDLIECDDSYEILCEPNDFFVARDKINNLNGKIYESEIKYVAQNKITNLDNEQKERLQRFIDSCDDDEDIQWVITNYEEN